VAVVGAYHEKGGISGKIGSGCRVYIGNKIGSGCRVYIGSIVGSWRRVCISGRVGIGSKVGIGASSSKDIFGLYTVPFLLHKASSIIYNKGIGK